MRKEFAAWVGDYGQRHPEVVMLTGDLGYQALEPVRAAFGERFINVGVSEQNMISVGAGLAAKGLRPFCYSIAPFAVFRPAEQIRLDVCLHDLDVKIVGNGGGYGYGIMGSTHHAIEDLAVLSSFQNMSCFLPVTGQDVATCGDAMMALRGPAYLRLNLGAMPAGLRLETPFEAVRAVLGEGLSGKGTGLTVVGLGPIVLNALTAMQRLSAAKAGALDVFAVSRFPVPTWPAALFESARRTGQVLVVEEHVERGGLAEHLALALVREGVSAKLHTRNARGYPGKVYGSQAFHQRESGLDADSLLSLLQACLS